MNVASSFRLDNSKSYKSITHLWRENGAATTILVGDSATLIGWVPIYTDHSQLPSQSCLREQWERGDASIPLLLSTGNNRPNNQLDGPGELLRFLNSKDFRAVISIDQPTLSVNADGDPVELTFLALAHVGFTSVRPEHFVSKLDWFLFYSGGTSHSCGDVLDNAGKITIRSYISLKLGFLGRVVGRRMTGHWPPWANLMIEYEFERGNTRDARVTFCGSAVPSQHGYLAWRVVSDYRMERDMTHAGYDGFVKAGSCTDALALRHSEWSSLKSLTLTDD